VHRRLTGRDGWNDDDAAIVGHRGDGWSVDGRDDDGGVGNASAGLVHDDQAQLRLIGLVGRTLVARLCGKRHSNSQPAHEGQESSLHLVNVFALKFGLIR